MPRAVPPPNIHRSRGLQLDKLSPGRKKFVTSIAEVVTSDPELDLFIRDKYLNVYYRGGNLWKITGLHADKINIFFDHNYLKIDDLPENLKLPDKNAPFDEWKDSLEQQKLVMNKWFKKHPKDEREIQHNLCTGHRTNINSALLIIDIEYAAWLHGTKDNKGDTGSRRLCRFDMVAMERQDIQPGKPLVLYLMEFKQGNKAIHGASGLQSHIQDFDQFLDKNNNDQKARNAFDESMKNIIKERVALGLLPAQLAEMNLDADIEIRKSILLCNCSNAVGINPQLKDDLKVIDYDHVKPNLSNTPPIY